MQTRVVALGVLALALAATFLAGAHHDLLAPPLKPTRLDRPLPTVSPGALAQGCAAWGEPVQTCLAQPEAIEFSSAGAVRY
jgi:hypothetical protein